MLILGKKKTIFEHISELRSRVFVSLAVFLIFCITSFFASEKIINLLRNDFFPHGVDVKLVASGPIDFIMAQINIAIFIGFFVSLPFFLYETYAFLKPGVTRGEAKIMRYSFISGIFLFFAGVVFSYFVLLKMGLWFLAGLASSAGVANLWNINDFVMFVFTTSAVMGLVFEMPLITYILTQIGIIDADFLKGKRSYAIILIFVVAAIITPQVDPVSLLMVAIPMVALFEISIFVARIFRRKK